VVDRVYKTNLPALRRALEKLRAEFSGMDPKTDWSQLRVEPLLGHAKRLEQRLKAQGTARLTMGVGMFHSDLVYLQENVKRLNAVLASEKQRLLRRARSLGGRAGSPDPAYRRRPSPPRARRRRGARVTAR
jgi:hypothetical protein